MYVRKSEIFDNPDHKILRVNMIGLGTHRLEQTHAINTIRNISQVLGGAYLCSAKHVRWYAFPTTDATETFRDILWKLYPNFEMWMTLDFPE